MRGGKQDPAWISAWKTPKGVTPPEFLDSYEALSAEDTFHDMWDPRGAASPMKTVAGATEAMRLVQVRSANLNSKWGAQELATSAEVDRIARIMALGENPGASDYERRLVLNWESRLPSYLHSSSRKLVTYDEIIKDKTTPGEPLRTKYTTSFAAGNILEINNAPGRTFKMLSDKDRAIVANFMLSYLWPSGKPVQGNQYNVTFDAGPVVIRRLLDSIDVKNLITPQNVADSAATGFNAMKTTTYAFPNTGRVKSNTFTGQNVDINYKSAGFGPLNPYGFSIEFTFKGFPGTGAIPFIHTLQFGPKQNSGPSVNYLVTSILRVGGLAGYSGPIQPNDREKSTIIDIALLVKLLVDNGYPAKFIEAFLLDLKRIGDHEQIAAAISIPNTLFATIDILCCFMARMTRMNNAWSNNDSAEIWLHRFDTTDLNLFQQFVRDHVAFAQEQLARIKAMFRLAPEPGRPLETLSIAITDFKEKGPKVYYVTSSRWKTELDKSVRTAISMPATLFLGGPSDDDELDQNGQTTLANSLTTHLMRFKFFDALKYATALNTKLTAVRSIPGVNEFIKDGEYERTVAMFDKLSSLSYMNPLAGTGFRSSMVPALPAQNARTNLLYTVPDTVPPVSVNATSVIFAIKSAFEHDRDSDLIGLCLTDQEIYRSTLFEGTTPQLIRGANNPTFRISKDAFDNFNSAFREFVGLLYPARGNTRSDYDKKVDESLGKFYKQRDAILKSFYDRDLAAKLEAIVDIESGLVAKAKRVPTANMVIKLQALAATNGLASDGTEPALEALKLPAPLSEGPMEGGGAGDEQFIDRIELFREICGMASAYVDSVLSAAYSAKGGAPSAYDLVKSDLHITFPEKIKSIRADYDSCIEAVNDIALKWTVGLLNIRETTLDQYGVPYMDSNTDRHITGLVNAVDPKRGEQPVPYVDVYGDDRIRLNDFWGDILVSEVPIEVRTLVLLTILNNWMRPDKAYKYFTDGKAPAFNLSGKPEWNEKLPLLLSSLLKGINAQGEDGYGNVITDELLRLVLPGVVVSKYNPPEIPGQGVIQTPPKAPDGPIPPREDSGWKTGWGRLASEQKKEKALKALAEAPRVLGQRRAAAAAPEAAAQAAEPAGAAEQAAQAATAQAEAAAAAARADAAAARADAAAAAAAEVDMNLPVAPAAEDDDAVPMNPAAAPAAAAAAEVEMAGQPDAAEAEDVPMNAGRRRTHRRSRLPKLI